MNARTSFHVPSGTSNGPSAWALAIIRRPSRLDQ